MAKTGKLTFGVIVGNRGFFPDELAKSGRDEILKFLKKMGYKTIAPTPSQTGFGCVETYQDAKQCAQLFRKNADKIDGIIVTLPNFGDEKGVAETLKQSGLHVPVLVHAFPDDPSRMSLKHRRDAFCGKISVCNNLKQYNIPCTLTLRHTDDLNSPSFQDDLEQFEATCRITSALKNLRIGAVGARPADFNTCRFSEKLLQDAGIDVETWDLSELLGRAERIKSSDGNLKKTVERIKKYANTGGVNKGNLEKMGRLLMVLEDWMGEKEISAIAIQCWTAMEEFYGVVPCGVMSMLSDNLKSAACESDVCGALSMHILQAASGTPSALVDWNNNYGNDPDRVVTFHCSNLPASLLDKADMSYQAIVAGAVGKSNTEGTICGTITPGPATVLRVSTDDYTGSIGGYVAEGEYTDDHLDTFGGAGVLYIQRLQALMHYICTMGLEHHVAVNKSNVGNAVAEALDTYLGWDVFVHE